MGRTMLKLRIKDPERLKQQQKQAEKEGKSPSMCQRIFCCAKNKHISIENNEMRPELYPIEWDDYPNQETEANDKILNT